MSHIDAERAIATLQEASNQGSEDALSQALEQLQVLVEDQSQIDNLDNRGLPSHLVSAVVVFNGNAGVLKRCIHIANRHLLPPGPGQAARFRELWRLLPTVLSMVESCLMTDDDPLAAGLMYSEFVMNIFNGEAGKENLLRLAEDCDLWSRMQKLVGAAFLLPSHCIAFAMIYAGLRICRQWKKSHPNLVQAFDAASPVSSALILAVKGKEELRTSINMFLDQCRTKFREGGLKLSKDWQQKMQHLIPSDKEVAGVHTIPCTRFSSGLSESSLACCAAVNEVSFSVLGITAMIYQLEGAEKYTPDINVNVLAAEGTEGGVLAQEHANFGSLTQKITSVHVDIPGMRLVWCVRGVATDPASATWHAVHFLNEGDAIKAQRLLELLRPGQEDGRVTMATPGAKKGKPTTAAMGQGHRPTAKLREDLRRASIASHKAVSAALSSIGNAARISIVHQEVTMSSQAVPPEQHVAAAISAPAGKAVSKVSQGAFILVKGMGAGEAGNGGVQGMMDMGEYYGDGQAEAQETLPVSQPPAGEGQVQGDAKGALEAAAAPVPVPVPSPPATGGKGGAVRGGSQPKQEKKSVPAAKPAGDFDYEEADGAGAQPKPTPAPAPVSAPAPAPAASQPASQGKRSKSAAPSTGGGTSSKAKAAAPVPVSAADGRPKRTAALFAPDYREEDGEETEEEEEGGQEGTRKKAAAVAKENRAPPAAAKSSKPQPSTTSRGDAFAFDEEEEEEEEGRGQPRSVPRPSQGQGKRQAGAAGGAAKPSILSSIVKGSSGNPAVVIQVRAAHHAPTTALPLHPALGQGPHHGSDPFGYEEEGDVPRGMGKGGPVAHTPGAGKSGPKFQASAPPPPPPASVSHPGRALSVVKGGVLPTATQARAHVHAAATVTSKPTAASATSRTQGLPTGGGKGKGGQEARQDAFAYRADGQGEEDIQGDTQEHPLDEDAMSTDARRGPRTVSHAPTQQGGVQGATGTAGEGKGAQAKTIPVPPTTALPRRSLFQDRDEGSSPDTDDGSAALPLFAGLGSGGGGAGGKGGKPGLALLHTSGEGGSSPDQDMAGSYSDDLGLASLNLSQDVEGPSLGLGLGLGTGKGGLGLGLGLGAGRTGKGKKPSRTAASAMDEDSEEESGGLNLGLSLGAKGRGGGERSARTGGGAVPSRQAASGALPLLSDYDNDISAWSLAVAASQKASAWSLTCGHVEEGVAQVDAALGQAAKELKAALAKLGSSNTALETLTASLSETHDALDATLSSMLSTVTSAAAARAGLQREYEREVKEWEGRVQARAAAAAAAFEQSLGKTSDAIIHAAKRAKEASRVSGKEKLTRDALDRLQAELE